jgi:hypothetical protein
LSWSLVRASNKPLDSRSVAALKKMLQHADSSSSKAFVVLQGEAMKAGKRVKAQTSAGGKSKDGKRAETGEIYKKWLKQNGAKAGKDAAAGGKGGNSAFGGRYDLSASHELPVSSTLHAQCSCLLALVRRLVLYSSGNCA